MNTLAWILFVAGTLVATATGAHSPPMWAPFGLGIALAVAGAMLLRRQSAKQAAGGDADGIHDLSGLREALHEVTANTAALEALPDQTHDLLERVEALQLEHLLPMLEARSILASSHGVKSYARVFTPIASGERCLNRAWSALADQNPAEARVQLGRARGHFEAAEQGWPASST
ncbi:MAG TPA: hypothetical protein DFR83_05865 [Deltaproteobacteria bacterium]|nr:hypothetical protein [Deltaproteobacteria bacterium]